MKRKIALILSVFILFTFVTAANGVAEGATAIVSALTPLSAQSSAIWDGSIATGYDSGDGSSEKPFIIKTGAQLALLAKQLEEGTDHTYSHFELGCNIVLNDTSNLQNWSKSAPKNRWKAIGKLDLGEYTSKGSFSGTFNGNCYSVSGIYINNDDDYQGLFGSIYGGTVTNICVKDSYMKGKDYIGGISGCIYGGIISSCFNTVNISGNLYVGGITGYNYAYSVNDCYNTGNITGKSAVGGIAGESFQSLLRNCYNIGSVSGDEYVGGVTGGYYYTTVKSCYYKNGSVDGEDGLTDAQMKQESSFVGFDFDNIWTIDSSTGYSYPQLTVYFDKSAGEQSALWDGSIAKGFDSGDGTEANPYIIKTAPQLAFFASSVNGGNTYQGKFIKLADDIKLNDNTKKNWVLNAIKWTPIGNDTLNGFSGNFNGDSHTVSGIYIDTNNVCQGLFGCVFEGTIKNLRISDSFIKGDYYVGGIAGYAGESYVTDCVSKATVYGITYVGGIVSSGELCSISNCRNDGIVIGAVGVGGIVGELYNEGTVAVCSNEGFVDGDTNIGGIVGEVSGSVVSTSENAGTVDGGYNVGGVTGAIETGTTTLCINYGIVIGLETIGGIVGFNSASNTLGCFNEGSVSGTSYIGGVAGHNYSNGTVIICYNKGLVKGDGMFIGGVAGSCENATLRNCFNMGSVSGYDGTGGVVGSAEGQMVSDCYNEGDVSGNVDVGGVVGYTSKVILEHCYNSGSVSGEEFIGAVVGGNNESSITGCYYKAGCAKDGRNTVQAGMGYELRGSSAIDIWKSTMSLTEAQMRLQQSYVGFDFDTIWEFSTDGGYVYPVLVNNPPPSKLTEKDGVIYGINPGTTVGDYADENTKIFNAKGKELTKDALIGTGCVIKTFGDDGNIKLEVTVCILGDVTGDGKRDSRDYLMLKRAVLGTYTLSGVNAKAGCLSGKETFAARDYVMLKRVVLGTYFI